ncbi:MAG: hypothetical protein H8E72_02685 [Candidatus Marinimicrobia bacterium]|nr:hypothetical protein [Candidatus Neomarinimicrobiota bacterium]
MKSNTPIHYIAPLIVLFGLLISNSIQRIDADIHLSHVQHLSIINQKEFGNLKSVNLDKGYSLLENCVELEIKSNTNWSLIVFGENISNNNFLLRTNASPFKPLSLNEIVLIENNHPTSSTIVSIDCKRIVGWDNTQPKQWNFSPIFELKSLE